MYHVLQCSYWTKAVQPQEIIKNRREDRRQPVGQYDRLAPKMPLGASRQRPPTHTNNRSSLSLFGRRIERVRGREWHRIIARTQHDMCVGVRVRGNKVPTYS